MKRLIFLLTVFLLLSGCAAVSPAAEIHTIPSTTQPAGLQNIVPEETQGSSGNPDALPTRLTLPVSQKEIRVSSSYAPYLNQIDKELLLAAETSLHTQADREGSYFLSKDSEGYLCLSLEIIVYKEPPTKDDMAMGGCGFDHDHLFFHERITRSPIISD